MSYFNTILHSFFLVVDVDQPANPIQRKYCKKFSSYCTFKLAKITNCDCKAIWEKIQDLYTNPLNFQNRQEKITTELSCVDTKPLKFVDRLTRLHLLLWDKGGWALKRILCPHNTNQWFRFYLTPFRNRFQIAQTPNMRHFWCCLISLFSLKFLNYWFSIRIMFHHYSRCF